MTKNLLWALLFLSFPVLAAPGQSDDPIADLLASRETQASTKSAEPITDAVDAVFKALSLVGTPYRYGGNSPDQGFDCSGFVNYVFYNVFGLKLPRSTADIAVNGGGENISRDKLQVGDLVLFNTMRRSFSHVGIYIGKGLFIHAPSSGGTVRMDNLNDNYWVQRFTGARRFLSTLAHQPQNSR